jgi:hypothetical protein
MDEGRGAKRCGRVSKKLATVMTVLTGASLVAAPAASAAGGASIANAPQLTSGAKYSATFPRSYRHNPTTEFWRVYLVAGDYFSLDGTTDREARYLDVKLFPAGTNDASLARKAPLDQASLNTVIRFAAPQTGTYPLEVTCDRNRACGAVEFAVYIALEVDLYIPPSARLRLSGMFTVTVRTPEDRPVTGRGLIVNLYGLWKGNFASVTHHVLGSAEVVSGKANIMYRLPAGLVGKTVSLQATAAGKGYLATSSSLCQARVT